MAENRHRRQIPADDDRGLLLELRLESGTVVAFDGRVVEVFVEHQPSRRFHIAHLGAPRALDAADGASTLTLEHTVTLTFARREAPACARLVASIADARATLLDGE